MIQSKVATIGVKTFFKEETKEIKERTIQKKSKEKKGVRMKKVRSLIIGL